MTSSSNNNGSKGWDSQTNAQFTETWSLGDKSEHKQPNQCDAAAQTRDSNGGNGNDFKSAGFPEQEVQQVWGNLNQPEEGNSCWGWGL